MSAELDALVADNMGWTEVNNVTWRDGAGNERTIGYGGDDTIFQPSINEVHAASVLDRIAALGWVAIVFTSGWYGKRLIRCCIMREPGGPAVDVVAETRPLAICRAFVQAMERWGDG